MKLPALEAKELTDEERAELAKQAFEIERRIKDTELTLRRAWWDFAEALYEFKELNGWKHLGYKTIGEWAAQPEIGMSERSFRRAAHLWRDLVVVKQLPPSDFNELEYSKVIEVAPAMMAGDVTQSQALSDAAMLSFSDVREKYRPANIARHGQQPDGSTPLNADDEPEYTNCPTCGSWVPEDLVDDLEVAIGKAVIDGDATEVSDG